MRVLLHDADATAFPNLALMKLSAWHKARGDTTLRWAPQLPYDIIYSSKVFTFTLSEYLSDACCGGTGYPTIQNELPDGIEHIKPDYALYGCKESYGFITRGCPRRCSWCVVPSKEGAIRAHARIEEFIAHRDVVLMDNNVLAHAHGIQQIEKIATLNLRVDFNQGLDARLIDDGIARRLARLQWLKPLRLACDTAAMMPAVQRAITLLRWHNVTPRRYFVYCLVKDVDDALERVKFLKGLHVDPFAQPYRSTNEPGGPTIEQQQFARWVNHKALYNSCTWENYHLTNGTTPSV